MRQIVLISPGQGELAEFLARRMLNEPLPPYQEWKKRLGFRRTKQEQGINLAGVDEQGCTWYWVAGGKSSDIIHLTLISALRLCGLMIDLWQIYCCEDEQMADQPLTDLKRSFHLH
jgi:hypothetical protein